MIAISLLLAALPLPSDAQATAQTPPPAKEKPVCRREPTLGSILPRRMCHSPAEWAAIDRANRANADAISGRRQLNPTGQVN